MELYFSLLGDFTMTVNGGMPVSLSATMGKQLQNLFQLILLERDHPLTKERMMDLLYKDKENGDPGGSLKYGVFRLREYFKRIRALDGITLITTQGAGYGIQKQNVTVTCDVEQFEDMWDQYHVWADPKGTEDLIERMIHLYKGKFYQTSSMLPWTTERREKYHDRYIRLIVESAARLWEQKKFASMSQLCHRALALDNLNEEVAYWYLQALVGEGRYAAAAAYYQEFSREMMSTFGELPSMKMRKLYTAMHDRREEQVSMKTLGQKMGEEGNITGAFFCNYEIFKYIYRMEVRRGERAETPAYVLLLEILDEGDMGSLLVWMNHLRESIRHTLRRGDVFTCVNKRQFLVLLPCKSEENGKLVIRRIQETFHQKKVYSGVHIQVSMQAVR